MPIVSAHIEQADKNADFARSFDWATTAYLDWVVTGLFYSALHYIDACLHDHHTKESPKGYHPVFHEDRTSLVGRQFPSLYYSYRALKDASEDARYELKSFTPAQVRELDDQDWQKVRAFALSCLDLPSS